MDTASFLSGMFLVGAIVTYISAIRYRREGNAPKARSAARSSIVLSLLAMAEALLASLPYVLS